MSRRTIRREHFPRPNIDEYGDSAGGLVYWVPFVGRWRWVVEEWINGDAVLAWGITRRGAERRHRRVVAMVKANA